MGRVGLCGGLPPWLAKATLLMSLQVVFPVVCVLTSSSYREGSPIGLGPAMMPSFYLNLPLQRFFFQIQAPSEALRLRAST